MMWHKPYYREERTIKRFAFLPIEAGREVRWLEFVTIRQEYIGFWRNMYFEDSLRS